MRSRLLILSCLLAAFILLGLSGVSTMQAQQRTGNNPVSFRFEQHFSTLSGVVILPYAPKTYMKLTRQGGNVDFDQIITNTQVFQQHLKPGLYQILSTDEVKIITTDYNAYTALNNAQHVARLKTLVAKTKIEHARGVRTASSKSARPNSVGGPIQVGEILTIIPVPRVSTANYAQEPPSISADRHVIFSGIHTRLKAVILGGVTAYNVSWDPGDNSGAITTTTNDGYNGAAVEHTYTGNVGDLIDAKITVTDATFATATKHYYMIIGNSGSQGDRIARSSDEALWYLHTQISRADGVVTYNPNLNFGAGGNEPATDQGYLDLNYGANSQNLIASTGMFSICLENTGHSITGGLNYSNDPSKDAYVDDLNRMINYLTDYNTLNPIYVGTNNFPAQKTYTGIGAVNFDTHGPGGFSNGIILVPVTHSVYDCGMHLQAICQAGYVDKAVPNRTEYASYYDVIGDYVDGIQQAQGYSGYAEGGWQYQIGDTTYNNSDGSTAAWACIGLEAATRANLLTPNAPLPSISVASFCIQALHDYWIQYDQISDLTQTTYNQDYRKNPNGYTEHLAGGFGYTVANYGTNPGKTGGGIVSLKLAGLADNDPKVLAAQGFLYRNFFSPDVLFSWNSARDAYGMYNILKGLTAANVVGANSLLTDHTYDYTIVGDPNHNKDLDGFTLAPFDWFNTLAGFIAGNDASDLGHQAWTENSTLSQGNDGHYAASGTRSSAIAPFLSGEWGMGYSDSEAGTNLNTAWQLAVMVGTVFTPPPVAVITHPSAAANETFIPIQVNGNDFYARFDPGGSYELNPNATIVSVKWNFGDNTPIISYTLPIQGGVGGTVPPNTALYPAGDVTTHHFTALGDYTVSLTVVDDKQQTGTTTITVHVTDAAVAPIAALTVQSQNTGQATDGSGNVQIGIIDAGPNIGKVTIQFDGSSSKDTSIAVKAPKNSRSISSFLWDWPVASSNNNTTPPLGDTLPSVNPGGSGDGTYAEGNVDTASIMNMLLNAGSKVAVPTYSFNFGTDPTQWPTSIIVKLKVASNFLSGALSTTISKQIILKPNSSLPSVVPSVKNLSVHNITDTTAIVSFDTVDQFGNAVATNGTVNYGTTSAYGSSQTDGILGIHHDVKLIGLLADTIYHYDVKVTTSGGGSSTTADATFRTLQSGVPSLSYSVAAHSLVGSMETVTFLVTNNGSGDALNFTANAFTANPNTITVNGVPLTFGGAGTTITKSGGTFSFTVTYTLPTGFNKKAFVATYKDTFSNSGGTNYNATVPNTVQVP